MSDNPERRIVIRPEDLARLPAPRPCPPSPPSSVLPPPPYPAPPSRRRILLVVAAISSIVLAGALAIVWVVTRDEKNGTGGKSSGAINIERVLKADATTTTGAQSVADVVGRMRAISLAGCPQDFSVAYVAHLHAWELLQAVEQDAIAFDADFNSGAAMLQAFLRGLMLDPFGQAREATAEQKRLKANYQRATSQIRDTFHRVEDISIAHGAELLPRDSPAFKR